MDFFPQRFPMSSLVLNAPWCVLVSPSPLVRERFQVNPVMLAWLAVVSLTPSFMAMAAAPADLSAATLDKVTVTATLSEQDTRLAPASTTVIDREELETTNPQNLLEAVREVPGVTLSPRQVGGRKTLSLRGLEGRHVLTLVDGRRIVATDDVVGHSDYQYGWLPMAAVERIEVIRGPMSTLYGSEALGGVINLITRRPDDQWQGELSVRAATTKGNDGGQQGSGSLYAAGPMGERVDLRLSAYSGYTPAVADADDPRYSEIEGGRVHAGTLGANIELTDQQSLEFNHFQGLEKRFYDDVARTGTGYQNQYDIRRRQSDLAWRGDFDGWRGQLRAYDGHTEILNYRTQNVATTRPQTLDDKVIDGHAVLNLGAHVLTVGGEARNEALTNAGLVGGHDDADHKALFVQDEISFGQNLHLTSGIRYDRHELFGHELSPRAYLVWEATPQWVIKGGYGHAFKAPTLKQISPNYVGAEGPHTFMGNADIRPETLDSFELSAHWQSDAVSFSATAFRSKVEDLITYRLLRQEGPRRFYQYDNVDNARISGLETGFGWDFSEAWSWQTSFSVLDSEDGRTGERLEYRPRTSATSHLDWAGDSGWSARLGMQRVGEQHSTQGELPAYTLWNLRVNKALTPDCDLQLAVENVGDLRLAEESPLFGYAERARTFSTHLRFRF